MTDIDIMTRFIADLHRATWDGDAEPLCRCLKRPFITYSNLGIRISDDRSDLIEDIRRYRETLAERGIVDRKFSIVEFETTPNAGSKLLVRWVDQDSVGDPIGTSLIRYYLSKDKEGRSLIDMIECLDLIQENPRQAWGEH